MKRKDIVFTWILFSTRLSVTIFFLDYIFIFAFFFAQFDANCLIQIVHRLMWSIADAYFDVFSLSALE